MILQCLLLVSLRAGSLMRIRGNYVGLVVSGVVSVSVWFRSKERPRNGIFGFNDGRNGMRAKK